MMPAKSEKVIVLAALRDCQSTLPTILSLCADISSSFTEAHFVFVENDSKDATREYIESWRANRKDCTLISPTYPIAHLKRTERLAICRNLALDFAKRHLIDFGLLIVFDVDLSINDLRASALVAAAEFLLSTPSAIGVFANSEPVYYDIWALRHPVWCPTDCWREIRHHRHWPLSYAEATFVSSRQLRIDRYAPPICVASAFNGLGIYRFAKVVDGRYCGVDLSGRETCEHVAFHASIAAQQERAFFILPSLVVDAPLQHLSAAFRLQPDETPNLASPTQNNESPSPEAPMQSLSVGARLLQRFRTFGRASRPSSPLPELVAENETDDLNNSIFFNIGSRVIELPADHKLPIYQNLHRLYDRFLPVMGMYLPSRSDHVIVDVGANVGDTAASMLDSCVHNFLCVEGHAPFFDMLCSNVKKQLMAPDRFILVNEVVGTGDFVGNLKANESTAHIEVEPCGQPVRSLDSIVAEHQLLDKVALLKIDTDGFDGDVLLSSTQIINRSEPLIYWENQFCGDKQLNLLERAYEHLSKNGYNHLWIFDNFGNLLLEECTFAALHSLNRYVAAQDGHDCTRTIYYTDVLASKDNYQKAAAEAISRYKCDVIAD